MKRFVFLFVIAGIVILGGLVWAGVFAWKNLRGVGPALRGPVGDISALIEKIPEETVPKPLETGTGSPQVTSTVNGTPLTLPKGFSISIFAKNVGSARVMIKNPGTDHILVSAPSQGRVSAFADTDGDGQAEERIDIVQGLNRPHGLAIWNDNGKWFLYVAESHGVRRYEYDPVSLKASNGKMIVELPDGGGHWSRTLLVLPGSGEMPDRLLISIGSSCNVCNEKDWRRAKVLIANMNGGDLKEYAKGLRNAVFMNLRPGTDQVWVTEMGRDLLGDDLPPDEINVLEEGKNYGWPICYGKNIHDTQFDKNTYIRNPCQEPFETPSEIDLPAHSAPLGLVFGSPSTWPAEFKDNLFVAYHGSWNRSEPTGYKIVRFIPDGQGNYSISTNFVSGWLTEQERSLGRPVDLLFVGDSLFISNDKAGVIYKIRP